MVVKGHVQSLPWLPRPGPMMLLLCNWLLASASGAVITRIEPQLAGWQGGSLITIKGQGFERNGIEGSTTVFFGAARCPVIEYYSSDTQLVCVAPKNPAEENLPVTVSLISYTEASFAKCGTSCVMYYRFGHTPILHRVSGAAHVGQPMSVGGVLRGSLAEEFEVFLGGQRCPLVADDDAYLNTNRWRDFDLQCLAPELTAGRYNVTVRVTSPDVAHGDAFAFPYTILQARHGQAFMVTVVPQVLAVSSHLSGKLGQQRLVIDGSAFDYEDCANNLVQVAGVAASVLRCTSSQLVVSVPAAPNATQIQGHRGLLQRVWQSIYLGYGAALAQLIIGMEKEPELTSIQAEATVGAGYNYADRYFQSLEAFFVPPVSANYSFYVLCDDRATVSISSTDSLDNLTAVAECCCGYRNHYYYKTEQISELLPLEGGHRYAFRITHQEFAGADFVRVAMRIHGAPYNEPADRRYQTLAEQQIIEVSTNVVREIQLVTFTGFTGGNFRLVGEKGISQNVNLLEPNIDDFVAALKMSVSTCSSFLVVRTEELGNRFLYTVHFGCPTASVFPMVKVLNVNLQASDQNVNIAVSRTQTASKPLSGMFRIKVGQQWTPTLELYGNLQAAIESLQNITHVTVNRGGNFMENVNWLVTFHAPQGDIPTMEIDATFLDGNELTVEVTTRQEGSLDAFFDPVPADFFELITEKPQVRVTVNSILAECSAALQDPDACTFSYDAALTPVIAAVNVPNPATIGDVLVILGSGFDPNATTITVQLGSSAAECVVTAVSVTELTCTLQHGQSGLYAPTLIFSSVGQAVLTGGLDIINYTLAVQDLSPLQGSVQGGNVLTLNGTGFAPNVTLNTVRLGTAECEVVAASFHQLTCLVSPSTVVALANMVHPLDNSSYTVAVTVAVAGIGPMAVGHYTYSWKDTPSVTDVTPSTFSAGISTRLTLHGAFDGNIEQASVTIGDRPCSNVEVSAENLTCTVSRADALPIDQQQGLELVLLLHLQGQVYRAHVDPEVTVTIVHVITAMSNTTGSLAGGSLLTLTGQGFHSKRDRMRVAIVDPSSGFEVLCAVVATAFTELTCRTHGSNGTEFTGDVTVTTNGIAVLCQGSCQFTFSSQKTPAVNTIGPNMSAGATELTVNGSGLTADTVITLGPHTCTIIAHIDDTWLRCAAPAMVAGHYPVRAVVPGLGNAAVASSVIFHSQLVFTAILPSNGSVAGGRVVTLQGHGFSSSAKNNQVAIGGVGQLAHIVAASTDKLVVVVPQYEVVSFQGTATRLITVTVRSDPDKASHMGKDHEHGNEHGGEEAEMDAQGTRTMVVDSSHCPEPTSCQFTYSSAETPTLTGFSPQMGTQGTALQIVGTGFDSMTAVSIGDAPCNVMNWTSTTLSCELGPTPAGIHRVFVTVPSKGTAQQATSAVFRVQPEVLSIEPTQNGYGGGVLLTIHGGGFANHAHGMAVTVCGVDCALESVSSSRVTCRTPALNTVGSMNSFGNVPVAKLSGTPMATSGQSRAAMAFDREFVAHYYSDSADRSTCGIGLDLGASARALITRLRFFPERSDLSQNAWFEASADGFSYSTIATIQSSVHEGWMYIDIAPTSPVRFVRYRGAKESYCKVRELEFWGYPVLVSDATSATSDLCNVTVAVYQSMTHSSLGPVMQPPTTLASQTVLISGQQLKYEVGHTPTIASVEPRWGSSLGGTRLTIHGAGFGTALPADVEVTVNSVECHVDLVTSTRIVCVTGSRNELESASLVVQLAGRGAALLRAPSTTVFRYLDRWSLPNTWTGDEMPIEGDSVIIPADQTVLLDMSPPRLFLLLVQGMLVFDRKDLSLNASYILVDGGRLEVGTEAEPFLHKAIITLHGDRRQSVEIPHIGAKVLAVRDAGGMVHHGEGHLVSETQRGYLDLHGRPRRRVWTKLAATANIGDTTIITAEPVDFEAGDKLVLTSSEQSFEEAEQVEVVRRLDNTSLVITPPLQRRHAAELYTAVEGRVVDLRCEVGLLSRNIVVQGDDNSEGQQYGVHTIASHGGSYRLENIEVRRCGQTGNLGRYCTHFHMANDMQDSYVRSNSIHHSFQRAVTVHGTMNTLVQNNFAFHVIGHTFFVEDGNERNNLFDANLGASTFRSFSMLKGDTKPATFWTASPRNLWRNNVAAGSINDGFWFELDRHPHGPSYTTSICPSHEHLVEFLNNTAHSNGIHGLRIYPVYLPLIDPCDSSSGPAPQYFHNFTAFHNGDHGIFGKNNGDLHHFNSSLVENGGDELFWTRLSSVAFGTNPHVADLLAVGSRDPAVPAQGKHGVFSPQDEYFYVSGATLVNYGDAGAIAACADCDVDSSLKQGGFTFRFNGLRFINSTRRVKWTVPFKQIFVDLDGSLTSHVNGTAMPFYAFNEHPACLRGDAMYDSGLICDGSVRVRRLQINQVEPRELDWKELNVTSAYGTDVVAFRPKEIYGHVFPIVAEGGYFVNHVSKIDFRNMRLRYSERAYIDTGTEHVMLKFKYTQYRHSFEVTYAGSGQEVGSVSSLQTLDATNDFGVGRIHYDTKTWDVMISTNGIDSAAGGMLGPYFMDIRALQCAPGQCGLPGALPLGPPRPWSLPSSWENGLLPTANEDMVILPGVYMILDMPVNSLPKFGKCTIYGKLEFLDTADRQLQCDSILVWGSLHVGSVAKAFTHQASIVLHGQLFSPTLIAHDSHFLGNKVAAIFGELILHGQAPSQPWTRLSETAAAGSSTLVLAEPVAWQADNQIVLAPTEYDASEMETLTVAAVATDQRTVTVTTSLQFTHFAGDIENGHGGSVRLAAAVGLLTRNVVLEGQLESASDKHGAHVVVGDVDFGSDGVQVGRAVIIGAELRHCGKLGSEHPSVLYHYRVAQTLETAPVNLLYFSSFTESFNYWVVSYGSVGLKIKNNIFHRTYRTAVDIDDKSVAPTIENNLVVGNFRSPDETKDWVRPFAGFFINTEVASLRNNVVSGSEDTGFAFKAGECGQDMARTAGNEAYGVLVGVFLLSHKSSCLQLDSIVVWKCAHVGILSVDQTSNVELSRVVVSDSHIGLSLNFIRGDVADNVVRVTDSYIFGSTVASQSCAKSSTCRAMDNKDLTGKTCRSVFGASYRRVGVILPQYLNRAKTCHRFGGLESCRPPTTPERMCSMPWEKRYGLPSTVRAHIEFTGITFAYFSQSDCGQKSVALTTNPSQYEFSPSMFFSGITWHAMAANASMWFARSSLTAPECIKGCDGLNFILGHDKDGSVLGLPGHFLSSVNAPLSQPPGPLGCRYNGDRGTFDCIGTFLHAATLDNLDRDRGFRRIGPLHVMRIHDAENRTSFSMGPFSDGCPKTTHFGQFPFAMQAGLEYHLYTSNTMPSNARLRFHSTDPSDAVLVKIFYTKPLVVNVFAGGSRVAQQTAYPALSSPRGANAFDPQARILVLTMRGGSTLAEQSYTLRVKNVVALTLGLTISVADFFGATLVRNLASLLNIPESRIKIVDVHVAGKVNRRRRAENSGIVVNIEIVDEQQDAVEDDEEFDAQLERFDATIAQLRTVASNGEMKQTFEQAGMAIASLVVAPPIGFGLSDSEPFTLQVTESGGSTDFSVGVVAGLAAGLLVLLVALVAMVLVKCKRAARRQQTKESNSTAMHDKVSPRLSLVSVEVLNMHSVASCTEVDSNTDSAVGAQVCSSQLPARDKDGVTETVQEIQPPVTKVPDGAAVATQQLQSIASRIEALNVLKFFMRTRPTWDYVPSYPWYYPDAAQDTVEAWMSQQRVGTFAVTGHTEVELHVKLCTGIKTCPVLQHPENHCFTVLVGSNRPLENHPEHRNMEELIMFLSTKPPGFDVPMLSPQENPRMEIPALRRQNWRQDESHAADH